MGGAPGVFGPAAEPLGAGSEGFQLGVGGGDQHGAAGATTWPNPRRQVAGAGRPPDVRG